MSPFGKSQHTYKLAWIRNGGAERGFCPTFVEVEERVKIFYPRFEACVELLAVYMLGCGSHGAGAELQVVVGWSGWKEKVRFRADTKDGG
jgi:hypothetical protein